MLNSSPITVSGPKVTSSSWVSGAAAPVAGLRLQEPSSPQVAISNDARQHQPLGFTVQRGQWYVEALGQVGEGVLAVGVKEQPREQRRLVMGPEDRHQRRSLTTHS